jgi:hypothetical protein
MNGKDVIERSLAMRIARVSVLHPAGMVAVALWTIATAAVALSFPISSSGVDILLLSST